MTIATVVRPFFLANLDAGFLFGVLDAIELRIGSAQKLLPRVDPIAVARVANRHSKRIGCLGARELAIDRRTQADNVVLRRPLLQYDRHSAQ